MLHERIDDGGAAVRHHEHVGGLDALPAADGRAVEPQALFEDVLAQLAERDGEVLPDAEEVGELQIDKLDLVVLRELDDF